MRVAIDIQSLLRQKTGVGHALDDLLRAMAALKTPDEIMPFYFSRRRLDLPYTRPGFEERRLTFPPGRALRWLWKYASFPKLDRFLDRPDVVHFPDFVARPVKRAAVVVTIHDLAFARLPETVEPKNRAFLAHHVPRSLERADAVIAVSDFTRREIEDLFPVARGKVHVVHHGVRSLNLTPPEDETLLPRLPERFILTVGTIEPRKNLDVLLDAMRLLRQQAAHTNIMLVVVGTRGWLSDRLEQRLATEQVQKHLIRLGYVSDATLRELYAKASMLALPTLYEGFGLPALEAMAAGVPVVCSNVASLPEVVGDAAVLVDELLPEPFAAALARVLDDPSYAGTLKQRGFERAAPFTWEHAARQTLDVYRSAVEARRAHRH